MLLPSPDRAGQQERKSRTLIASLPLGVRGYPYMAIPVRQDTAALSNATTSSRSQSFTDPCRAPLSTDRQVRRPRGCLAYPWTYGPIRRDSGVARLEGRRCGHRHVDVSATEVGGLDFFEVRGAESTRTLGDALQDDSVDVPRP